MQIMLIILICLSSLPQRHQPLCHRPIFDRHPHIEQLDRWQKYGIDDLLVELK